MQSLRQVCRNRGIAPSTVFRLGETFVQPGPPYGVEVEKAAQTSSPFDHETHFWVTASKKPLTPNHIAAHAAGRISIGSYARWYPLAGWLDIDDWERAAVEELRHRHGLDPRHAILGKTRSPDSWALVYKPVYKGKPMTARLFDKLGVKLASLESVESFPRHREQFGRVPFGKYFTPADPGREGMGVEELLREFDKLLPYEMFNRFDFDLPPREGLLLQPIDATGAGAGWFVEGWELFHTGLQARGTRHEAQAKVLYYLFRSNYPPWAAERHCYEWIKHKHHGYSDAINRGLYQRVRGEIHRQAKSLYGAFEEGEFFPDTPHHGFNGLITKPDLEEIARLAGGSAPRVKFYTQLIRYANARRRQPWVRVHSDKLKQWGSKRTYNRYLNELEKAGVVHRNSAYYAGGPGVGMSRSITFTGWRFATDEQIARDSILVDERAPDSVEETIRAAFEPREYRQLLTAAGASPGTARLQTWRLYGDE